MKIYGHIGFINNCRIEWLIINDGKYLFNHIQTIFVDRPLFVTQAISNIEDYSHSTRLLAATTLRNVLGTRNLAEILSERESISRVMQDALDEATDPWGVKAERVEMWEWEIGNIYSLFSWIECDIAAKMWDFQCNYRGPWQPRLRQHARPELRWGCE